MSVDDTHGALQRVTTIYYLQVVMRPPSVGVWGCCMLHARGTQHCSVVVLGLAIRVAPVSGLGGETLILRFATLGL